MPAQKTFHSYAVNEGKMTVGDLTNFSVESGICPTILSEVEVKQIYDHVDDSGHGLTFEDFQKALIVLSISAFSKQTIT